MNRNWTFLMLLMFFAASVNAQNFNYGLLAEGGPSWSTYDGFSHDNRGFGFSASVGLWIEKSIGHKSSVEMNVNWFRHEDRLTRSGVPLTGPMGEFWGVISSTSSLTSNYISIPLLYCYKINKWLQISIGPQTSIFLNGVDKYEAKGSENQVSFDVKTSTKFKGNSLLDFGPRIEIEFVFKNYMRINLSHYRGVQNVSKSIALFERKNRNVTMGLKYPLKSKI